MTEKNIPVLNSEHLMKLFGNFDENIKLLEQKLDAKITMRDDGIKIIGDDAAVEKASRTLLSFLEFMERGEELNEQSVRYILHLVDQQREDDIKNFAKDVVCITTKGKPVKAKTIGQQKYIDTIRKNTIIFGVGPAGTGKTYLAVALAVKAFKAGDVSRIILTRPAVEAGEKLGFLPGDLQTKVDPYLRPLYDALFEMFGAETFARHMEKGSIEVAPLAYMRGRTLDDSFIILDEAQNTSPEQMKMFLTRLGASSKAVITGDVTQIDLPNPAKSGLLDAVKILADIEDIGVVYFSDKDVVRHRLVAEIIRAYDKQNAPPNKKTEKNKNDGRRIKTPRFRDKRG